MPATNPIRPGSFTLAFAASAAALFTACAGQAPQTPTAPPRSTTLDAATAARVCQVASLRLTAATLVFTGLADPIFSPLELADDQQRLHTRHGAAAASQFARAFFVPGMTHCSGGPATDDFDGLSALVRWVEQGEAPQRVLARGCGQVPATVNRPLCPWPTVARYDGGDASGAASFSCR